jgi:FixJ family two-component response regulator
MHVARRDAHESQSSSARDSRFDVDLHETPPWPHGLERLRTSAPKQMVFIVNGDSHMRERLHEILACDGLHVVSFASAAEYAAFRKPDLPACLILDVVLPDVSGLDLQQRIAETDAPIVFVTREGDVSCSVRAIKAGAVDFLTTPLKSRDLLQAVRAAIDQDRVTRLAREKRAELQQRFSRLTPRERQVLQLVISGLLNKQAALELGISETTIQIHRGRIMQKMAAGSFADLVRMAATLRVPLARYGNAPRDSCAAPSLAACAPPYIRVAAICTCDVRTEKTFGNTEASM